MFGLMGRGKRKKKDGLRVALRYVEGDSLIHRLDPRAKLFMIVAFGAAAILTGKLTSMAALFAMVLLLVATVRHRRTVAPVDERKSSRSWWS